jgi:flagellar biosynthetic protein FliR
VDLTAFTTLGFLLVRPGALMLGAPAFGGAHAPATVKIGLTVLLALTLAPLVQMPGAQSGVGAAVIVARELAIGLAFSLAMRVLTAAAEFGGHLIGFQMGLSYSAIVDPQSGVRNNLLATLYANIAVLVFLLTNAHHAFLRALADSYVQLPIGTGALGPSLSTATTRLLGLVFAFGARLAAPVIVVLLIAEIAMALVARSAPSLNLMTVGAPVRIIAGLIVLGIVLPAALSLFAGMSNIVLQAGVSTAGAFR